MSEPVIRIPLSEVEKHRAELAALHARVAELESWLAEMPELRAECESLGDQLYAIRAVLGPPPLPEHVDHNPFAELTERARLLVEDVYGSDPRPRDVRRVAHDRARVEHIELLERAVRSQVHQNRSMRRTLQMAAETLDDVGVAASLGMMLPRATVDKAASAARTWLATGGPTRVHERALEERAKHRLVRWFGRTPARAGHELAQRSGSRVVAKVHAEFATAEAETLRNKDPKPVDAFTIALRESVDICERMRVTMREVSDALFAQQAGRDVSDTVMCGLQSTASAWAGAGGEGKHPLIAAERARRDDTATTKKAPKAAPKPKESAAQVDIEEAIERAKTTAPPTKPKRTRTKKPKHDATVLNAAEGITTTPDGSVWPAAEARRRDAEDPDWMPEPEWAPDGGRLRFLEEDEAAGRIGVQPDCPSAKALAEIRSGKRCALCGRRAWRNEHTRGCPKEAATATA